MNNNILKILPLQDRTNIVLVKNNARRIVSPLISLPVIIFLKGVFNHGRFKTVRVLK
jgi:hypothetical protein